MQKLHKRVMDAIRRQAVAEYPRECCGLLVQVGRGVRYVPCENRARGTEHFIISAEDYALAEDVGEIKAVVHSHPEASAEPSQADLVACEASGLPWHIIAIRKDDDGGIVESGFSTFFPSGYQAPLVGRMFYHGVLDCYTVVRDFYQRELGIVLPDYERHDDWWLGDDDLYVQHYEHAGFVLLPPGSEVAYGDLIVMQMRSEKANHGAVYLGDVPLKEAPHLHRVPNAMLHHMHGRLSERAVYGGFYVESTRMILRHKEMMCRA